MRLCGAIFLAARYCLQTKNFGPLFFISAITSKFGLLDLGEPNRLKKARSISNRSVAEVEGRSAYILRVSSRTRGDGEDPQPLMNTHITLCIPVPLGVIPGLH